MELHGDQERNGQMDTSNDSLNATSSEIDQTVRDISIIFGLSPHPNLATTTSAIEKRIESIKNGSKGGTTKNPIIVPLEQLEIGAPPSGSKAFDNALRVLRLSYGARLRELQTQINATIGQVQKITANPRADLTLGRIGR